MTALSEYLSQLNSTDSQWGVWVNPENPTEEYRLGQYCFDNGGVADDWVCIGSLDNLSFGFQSESDAFDDCFKVSPIFDGTEYQNQAKDEVYELYLQQDLPPVLQKKVEGYIENWQSEASEWEADCFVEEKLPMILEAAKESLYI